MTTISMNQSAVAFQRKGQNVINAGQKAAKQIQVSQLPKDVQREIFIKESASKTNIASNLFGLNKIFSKIANFFK